MTYQISARCISLAETNVQQALADDFNPRRDLPAFIDFAISRANYSDVAAALYAVIFPREWNGKKHFVEYLIDPWLADELRIVRVARVFRLVPTEQYLRSSRFDVNDLKNATRKPRKSKRAWVALAALGFVRGPHGRPVELDVEQFAPWPKHEKERAAILLRLTALNTLIP